MTLPNESNAGGPYGRVLNALAEKYPYAHTAATLGDAAGVHGRQLGGTLRALRERGVIERTGDYIWMTGAAQFVWELRQ